MVNEVSCMPTRTSLGRNWFCDEQGRNPANNMAVSIGSFGKPRVMGAIESLGCNWWKNMHQIDA